MMPVSTGGEGARRGARRAGSASVPVRGLDRPGTMLMDDRSPGEGSGRTYVFAGPRQVLAAHTPDQVISAVEAIDDMVSRGFVVAGYVGYEAGLALTGLTEAAARTAVRSAPRPPLLWLGVYDGVEEYPAEEVEVDAQGQVADITAFRSSVSGKEYTESVRRIREFITAGDVYQVNYTYRLRFRNRGTALALFGRLRRAHPVPHGAYLDAGSFQVVSLSPELFLRRSGDEILTRPMKGTAPRGRWTEEDLAAAESLHMDAKNRAENVMIVDLMRNDIGRVCRTGSVSVPHLFRVGRYGSVLQMTSDVSGRLREGVGTSDLLRAVLPPGSVTGAPKRRAMERIHQLERDPRGPYCGVMGFFGPGPRAYLNVAIRTVVQEGDRCELGIGGGIVFDSSERAERREAELKAAFLRSEPREFKLKETLRCEAVAQGDVAQGQPLDSYPLLGSISDALGNRLPTSIARSRRPECVRFWPKWGARCWPPRGDAGTQRQGWRCRSTLGVGWRPSGIGSIQPPTTPSVCCWRRSGSIRPISSSTTRRAFGTGTTTVSGRLFLKVASTPCTSTAVVS